MKARPRAGVTPNKGGAVGPPRLYFTARPPRVRASPVRPPSEANPSKALNPSANAQERAAAAQRAIAGGLSAEVRAKLDAGELIGSSADFETIMAELRRDNGIRALYYDMFQVSRDNLEESLLIRSNDPLTHFYYGKVLS